MGDGSELMPVNATSSGKPKWLLALILRGSEKNNATGSRRTRVAGARTAVERLKLELRAVRKRGLGNQLPDRRGWNLEQTLAFVVSASLGVSNG
jgi:hypothetical protein